MEVILLKDVKQVGKKDEKVKVSDGYANNYLIPFKLAVPVTKHSEAILLKQKKDEAILKEKNYQEALALKEKLESLVTDFYLKTGKDGKVFGSVSAKQVCDKFSELYKIDLDKRKFIDKGPFTSLGCYHVRVELFKDVIGNVNIRLLEDKNDG